MECALKSMADHIASRTHNSFYKDSLSPMHWEGPTPRAREVA